MATEFQEKLFNTIASIPEGRVSTYGHVARAVGAGGMARYITSTMKSHPKFNMLPWHRVVYADGTMWHAGMDNREERVKIFKNEGIEVTDENKIVNFHEVLYTFED